MCNSEFIVTSSQTLQRQQKECSAKLLGDILTAQQGYHNTNCEEKCQYQYNTHKNIPIAIQTVPPDDEQKSAQNT
jgi:hypothetical protein